MAAEPVTNKNQAHSSNIQGMRPMRRRGMRATGDSRYSGATLLLG
jgi:hypothetical protein